MACSTLRGARGRANEAAKNAPSRTRPSSSLFLLFQATSVVNATALLEAINATKYELLAEPLIPTAKPNKSAAVADVLAEFNATLRSNKTHSVVVVGPTFKGNVTAMEAELEALTAKDGSKPWGANGTWLANSSFSPLQKWGMKVGKGKRGVERKERQMAPERGAARAARPTPSPLPAPAALPGLHQQDVDQAAGDAGAHDAAGGDGAADADAGALDVRGGGGGAARGRARPPTTAPAM